jgi:hypothetical protein
MSFDIERLKVDESLWPEGANYFLPGGIFASECLQVGRKDAIPRPTKPEWVDGLPPVGEECEITTEYGWLPCTIVAHGEDYAVAHIHPNENNLKVDWSRHGFRPIQTPEQRQREELLSIIEDLGYSSHGVADAILSKYNLTEK